MQILSLFDGISCGQLALKKLGFDNFTYMASEIDNNVNQIIQSFPGVVIFVDPSDNEVTFEETMSQKFSAVSTKLDSANAKIAELTPKPVPVV